jgi:hypothetical protein
MASKNIFAPAIICRYCGPTWLAPLITRSLYTLATVALPLDTPPADLDESRQSHAECAFA